MNLGQVYWQAERRLNQLARGLRAVNHGIFLGLIDDFEGLAADFFAEDRYPDPDYNQQGLFAWEERAIREFFPETGRILVAAMGGGRELVALEKLGYEVDGFDCVPALVETARTLLPDSRLWCTAPNGVPDIDTPYDAAIVGWGGYTCMFDPEARLAFLRAMAETVPPGAPILLSFFVRGDDDRAWRTTHQIANRIRTWRGRDPIPAGDFLTYSRVHAFTEAELRGELDEAGLSLQIFRTDPYGHAVATRDEAD